MASDALRRWIMTGRKPIVDGRAAAGVVVPSLWDYVAIPDRRVIWAILGEVVDHGIKNPKHGTDCACMDRYIRMIRNQVERAIPPTDDLYENLDARSRVRHVLMKAINRL